MSDILKKNLNKVILGNALEVLKEFPAGSIDCCLTSSPYFWKRHYGTVTIWDYNPNCKHDFSINAYNKSDIRYRGNNSIVGLNRNKLAFTAKSTEFARDGNTNPKYRIANTDSPKESYFCAKCGAWFGELGLEPTVDLFIKHLCDIFDEVKRVLTDYGALYVNLMDTYQNKSLLLVPDKFLIEMEKRGWILRNKIIWYKENAMPDPTKTRLTIDFEPIFFFVKNKNHYFEQQFEPLTQATMKRAKNKFSKGKVGQYAGLKAENLRSYYDKVLRGEVRGRNMRTVWAIKTEKSGEKHTARFPNEIVKRVVNMSCPVGVCLKCNKPRTKNIELVPLKPREQTKLLSKVRVDSMERPPDDDSWIKIIVEKGYSDCGCGKGFRKGIILDPFVGMGTTVKVARQMGRNGIGIDLNSDYCERANQKLAGFKIPAKAEDHITLDNFPGVESET
ncbi:MAG: site-specific DNA-methyltransferase [Candidatus Heimdallarchaeota archaeon]|nr:site-specific DNA-methyltransferase [Candidatus Heimdallarchaeota archaeon]